VDTRLHRQVAIKVLADWLTSSAPAMEHLQREVRTASILHHPNICTVYDVGTTPSPFIAMELLDGESLQQRLARGTLDVMAMLDIAIGIADGLAEAHGYGFVHHDIRPANIFLTAHGPKLLDFGLATSHATSTSGGWSRDGTRPIDENITDFGLTVGTSVYMSPEQLLDEDVDARTDVFSLGLVLYEMTTGGPAFSGGTGAAAGAGTLYELPVPPIDRAPHIPARLNDIELKALEKNREERYQTAADLRADLRRVRRELESQSAHSMSSTTDRGRDSTAHGSRFDTLPTGRSWYTSQRVTIVLAILALAAGALALYFRSGARQSALEPSTLSTADLQVARLDRTADAERPAIAPDGNYLAFIRRQNGRDSLHVRQMATLTTAEILKPEADVTLWGATVSPDSGFVDYVKRVGGGAFDLWRVPFLGGTPRRLLERVHSPIGWSPDGRRFAFIRADFARATTSVMLADTTGGTEKALAERTRPAQFVSLLIASRPSVAPAWSPNGRVLAIVGAGAGSDPEEGDVTFIDADTGAVQRVALPSSFIRGLVWLNDRLLILNAALPGSPLQLHQLAYPTGRVSSLTRDANDYDGISVPADRRTIVGARRERRTDISLLDASGRIAAAGPDISAVALQTEAERISWVGNRILYSTWAWTPGSAPQQLMQQQARALTGSSDGVALVFSRNTGLWRADATGGGLTLLTSNDAFDPIVTPDNRSVIFLSSKTGQQSPWIVPLGGGEPRQLINAFAGSPAFDISPDGRLLMFPSRDDQKGPTVIVCELPRCDRVRSIPAFASTRIRWTPDGAGIAYIEPVGRGNIWTRPLAGGTPVQLTHFEDRTIVDFDYSPDRKQIVVARRLETNDIVVLKGLQR